MRMPGKTGAIVVRPVVAEIVEQQERIELAGIAEAEGAAKLYAGALDGGLRSDDAFDCSGRCGPSGGCGSNRHGAMTFSGVESVASKMGCASAGARRQKLDTGRPYSGCRGGYGSVTMPVQNCCLSPTSTSYLRTKPSLPSDETRITVMPAGSVPSAAD